MKAILAVFIYLCRVKNPLSAYSNLPAAEIASSLNEALKSRGCAVVTAPPGAGKSTLLPLTMLQCLEEGQRVLLLEPRRVAARQIARRMASMLGESVGRTVGYRVRFESRVSSDTRIEVLTEGVLTRLLCDDPTLEGVGAVIFDEFHERNLQSDVALALLRQTRSILRADLKLAIMSATIDAGAICSALDAPLIESRGRLFEVETFWRESDPPEAEIPRLCAWLSRSILKEREGDILVFLPSEAMIRRTSELLETIPEGCVTLPLYGMLDAAAQDRAISPDPQGRRKIILATPIAETSLTIEGVRNVIDSGLCRKAVFDPRTGLSRLETVRISRDMADQRRGRAARTGPGRCYRLWCKASEARMEENRTPEILEADLSATLLDIAVWGGCSFEQLPWLDPVPAKHLADARKCLSLIGALDGKGELSAEGRRIHALPCHPRIARMISCAADPSQKALAADIAALLEERDPLDSATAGADINERIRALRSGRLSGPLGARITTASRHYRKLSGASDDSDSPDPFLSGALLAHAYPERIAFNRQGHFQLSGGEKLRLDPSDPLQAFEYLAVASAGIVQGGTGNIFLAAPLDPESVADLTSERERLGWDPRLGTLMLRCDRCIGSLVIGSRPLEGVPRERMLEAVAAAALRQGASMFDFNDKVANLQRRLACAAEWRPDIGLPDLSAGELLRRVPEWLPAFAPRTLNVQELKKIDLCEVMLSLLDYSQRQELDKYAPDFIEVPTGSRIRLEYRQGAEAPVLRVRLQECFGLRRSPRVDGGRKTVLMELLSPGFKAVQLTSDLESFWSGTYFEVRKELRRRYPKHSWPDNPLEAPPVRGARKKGE